MSIFESELDGDFIQYRYDLLNDRSIIEDNANPYRHLLNLQRLGLAIPMVNKMTEFEQKVLELAKLSNEEAARGKYGPTYVMKQRTAPEYNLTIDEIIEKNNNDPLVSEWYPNFYSNKVLHLPLDNDELNENLDEVMENTDNAGYIGTVEHFNDVVYNDYDSDEYDSDDSDSYDDDSDTWKPEMIGKGYDEKGKYFVKFGVKVSKPVDWDTLIKMVRRKHKKAKGEPKALYTKKINAFAKLIYKELSKYNLLTKVDDSKMISDKEEKKQRSRAIVFDSELRTLNKMKSLIDKQIERNRKGYDNAVIREDESNLKTMLQNQYITGRDTDEIITNYITAKLSERAANESLATLRKIIKENPDLQTSDKTLAELMRIDEMRKLSKKKAKDDRIKMGIIEKNPVIIKELKKAYSEATKTPVESVQMSELIELPIEIYEKANEEANKSLKDPNDKIDELTKNISLLGSLIYKNNVEMIEDVDLISAETDKIIIEAATEFKKAEEINEEAKKSSIGFDEAVNKKINDELSGSLTKANNKDDYIELLNSAIYLLKELRKDIDEGVEPFNFPNKEYTKSRLNTLIGNYLLMLQEHAERNNIDDFRVFNIEKTFGENDDTENPTVVEMIKLLQDLPSKTQLSAIVNKKYKKGSPENNEYREFFDKYLSVKAIPEYRKRLANTEEEQNEIEEEAKEMNEKQKLINEAKLLIGDWEGIKKEYKKILNSPVPTAQRSSIDENVRIFKKAENDEYLLNKLTLESLKNMIDGIKGLREPLEEHKKLLKDIETKKGKEWIDMEGINQFNKGYAEHKKLADDLTQDKLDKLMKLIDSNESLKADKKTELLNNVQRVKDLVGNKRLVDNLTVKALTELNQDIFKVMSEIAPKSTTLTPTITEKGLTLSYMPMIESIKKAISSTGESILEAMKPKNEPTEEDLDEKFNNVMNYLEKNKDYITNFILDFKDTPLIKILPMLNKEEFTEEDKQKIIKSFDESSNKIKPKIDELASKKEKLDEMLESDKYVKVGEYLLDKPDDEARTALNNIEDFKNTVNLGKYKNIKEILHVYDNKIKDLDEIITKKSAEMTTGQGLKKTTAKKTMKNNGRDPQPKPKPKGRSKAKK